MKDQLAELIHKQWAHWTRYFLDNLNLPNIIRWHHQAKTPYQHLTEVDKEKDRKFVQAYIDVIQPKVADYIYKTQGTEPTDEMWEEIWR